MKKEVTEIVLTFKTSDGEKKTVFIDVLDILKEGGTLDTFDWGAFIRDVLE